MTALFTVLAIDAYRAQRDNVTALLTLISGAVGIILAPGSMLLVSMGTYTALLIVRFFIANHGEHCRNTRYPPQRITQQ